MKIYKYLGGIMKDLKIKLGIIVSFIFFTGCGGGGGGGGGSNVAVRPNIPNPQV